jgi:hypothetical protein
MNELIQTLANQAHEYALGVYDQRTATEGQANVLFYQIRDHRFAQLIVRECMACSTWVGKVNMNAIEPVHTAHAINQRIKQHFGVEE